VWSSPGNESVRTVVVCATEPIAIEGVRSLLESAEALSLAGTETTIPDAIDAVRELEPSILLLDKAFGSHAVMECVGVLRKSGAATAVIVWASAVPEAESLRFLQAGAAGVIRKTSRLDALLTCLREVKRGTPWLEHPAAPDPYKPRQLAHNALTARELQVMELVERGMKNKDIAETLGIRTGTVKIHLKHIFEKTGIRGRYGLALSGLKEKGLLVPAMLEM